MVYQHHRALPPAAAVASAIKLVNKATHDFIETAASLPSFDGGGAQDQQLSRYVDVLRAIIRITLHWTSQSTRYSPRI